jgi:hypothetical protein
MKVSSPALSLFRSGTLAFHTVAVQVQEGMAWTRAGLWGWRPGRRITLPLALLAGLGITGGAHATTITRPDFTAMATAIVTPARLPSNDSAPVSLTVKGNGTSSSPIDRPSYPLKRVDFQLDRQISLDTEGLPTCAPDDIEQVSPPVARGICGRALVGTGTADVTLLQAAGDSATASVRFDLLFFNVTKGRKPTLLLYRSSPEITASATTLPFLVGNHIRYEDIGGGDNRTITSTFTFRLGKTWRYHGERHSLLSAHCTTGRFKNPVTFALDSGNLSGAPTVQSCTKQGK